jgi:2,5-dihydroxypyridine 5,6-dioxygenase
MRPDMYPDFIDACNSVAELAGLQAGEKVCIMADQAVEPEVIYAIFATARLRKAEAYLCMVEDFVEWQVPEVIAEAVGRADVVFHAWPAAEGKFGKKMRGEKGARWVSFGACRNIENFCSEATRFPAPLLSRIVKATWAIIDHGQREAKIRITDTKGTDLSLILSRAELDRLATDRRWQGKLLADEPGTRAHLPSPHGPNLYHEGQGGRNETLNGIVCYDSIVGFSGVYNGNFGDSNFVEPVRVHVRNGKVTKVDGGWESKVLAELTKDGGHLAEIGLGFNPKAASYGGRATGMAGPSRSGALHIATGGDAGEHMDGCLFRATVTIDGRPIIENGHIVALDDPEVRQLAEKYRTKHEGSWLWTATEHRELQHYR